MDLFHYLSSVGLNTIVFLLNIKKKKIHEDALDAKTQVVWLQFKQGFS